MYVHRMITEKNRKENVTWNHGAELSTSLTTMDFVVIATEDVIPVPYTGTPCYSVTKRTS